MGGLNKVTEVFTRGEIFLHSGDLLRGGGLEFLSDCGRDTGCAGGFEEGFEFDFIHLVEGFVEELMEGNVLEEVAGVLVCAEGEWGGVGGGHSGDLKEIRERMSATCSSFGEKLETSVGSGMVDSISWAKR